jgi:hypothetical protein
MPDAKVLCFGCNSILVTPLSVLENREPFECRFCHEDLQPNHTEPDCDFCRGAGYATVSDVIWICLGAGE